MDTPANNIPQEFILDGSVSYWNVDRDNLLSLRSLFAFLQEAAIRHADQCGAGVRAKASRGESWVLHRMAVSVHRYPRYEEALRVETWSTGIRAFKGICRVPREVADGFPTRSGAAFFPDLEKLQLEPAAGGSIEHDVTVRYSDFDGNGHVNNTAYFDYLQTAFAARGFSPRPGTIQIQFLKEIAPAVEHVRVSLERRGQAVAFSLGGATVVFAHGLAAQE